MRTTARGRVPGARWLPSLLRTSNLPVERARITEGVAMDVGDRAAHRRVMRTRRGRNAKGSPN
jgi:hypothetical protein